MAKSPFDIARIIDRYLRGEMSEHEEQEFLKLLEENASLRSILAHYKDSEDALRRLRYMQRRDVDAAWARVEAKWGKTGNNPVWWTRRKTAWTIGIAASISLIIGLLFVFQTPIDKQLLPDISTHYTHDVSPGSHQATLTLSTGEVVQLTNTTIKLTEKDGTALGGNEGILRYEKRAQENHPTAFYNTIHVPKSGTYQIVLPDGSKVWLNALSSLTFPTRFTGETRKVTLTGEGYFEVSRNTKQPFIVSTQGTEVVVLGTSFNINSYKGTNETTLVEGKVKIASNKKETILHPGEKASIKRNDIVVSHADIEKTLAWKNGYFQFESDDISTVLEEIGRWYDLEIAYIGTMPEFTFSGGISRNVNLSAVLDIITEVSELQFEINGKQLMVLPLKSAR